MEPNYRQTRRELQTAIDAELDPIRRQLTNIWWEWHDASKRLSTMITELAEAQAKLTLLAIETLTDELPFGAPEGDEDQVQEV